MASNKTKRQGASKQAAPAQKSATSQDAAKAVAQKASAKSASDTKKGKDAKSKKDAKPGFLTKTRTYFKNVRTEVKRVVWPSKEDLVKYTAAVVGMLVFFGLLIAVADAVILPALYAFSGLRG